MKILFEWENLSDDVCEVVDRAKVYGGWIIRSHIYEKDFRHHSESMVFIPDPNHEWEIE